MNQLETLLDTLIQRGWKPWGLEYFVYVLVSGSIVSFVTAKGATIYRGMRELVSLESGLWQFCVENGLCKGDIYERIKADLQVLGAGESHQSGRDYQYRLIESALVPEDKLGQFLLDNIIVGGKKE